MTGRRVQLLTKLSDQSRFVVDPAQDVRGRTVVDNEESEVGKVDDLLIDPNSGQVHFLEIEHGGVLGLGSTQSYVPVEIISRITDEEVHLERSGKQVAHAPRYDPELLLRENHFEEIYRYYGYGP